MISEDKIKAGAKGIRASQIKRARRNGTIIVSWDDLDPDRKTDIHEDARACLEAAERA